jgi:hypothetical protein
MEWLWAKNISAEGAKQHNPGRKPREKRGGETSSERAAQVFSPFIRSDINSCVSALIVSQDQKTDRGYNSKDHLSFVNGHLSFARRRQWSSPK